jgi:hypothetical protein
MPGVVCSTERGPRACSSGSDSIPLAQLTQLHGLLMQQPGATHSEQLRMAQVTQAKHQSSQAHLGLMQIHSLLHAGAGKSVMGYSQPRQIAHLRDGVPATPQEVVAALSEYMSRPSRPKPPAGCAADAVKLFVGNIPKHCTEAVLHKVFQCYGVIIEIAVVRRNSGTYLPLRILTMFIFLLCL